MRGPGSLHVITGCMFAGKTDELMRLLRRASVGGRSVMLIRPSADTRSPAEVAESRSGARFESIAVRSASDIVPTVMATPAEVVAIDEVEFFGDEVAAVADRLATDGYEVIVSGLDTDFAGRPFGALPNLLAMADSVTKLSAVCVFPGCGEEATRTQRLVNNEPAAIDDPLIVVGGTEGAREPDRYEARCRTHHRVAPARHGMAADPELVAAAPESSSANGNGHEEFSLSDLPAP
ncbi:MAG: thymidine kinase [Chloroflexota bacterium]